MDTTRGRACRTAWGVVLRACGGVSHRGCRFTAELGCGRTEARHDRIQRRRGERVGRRELDRIYRVGPDASGAEKVLIALSRLFRANHHQGGEHRCARRSGTGKARNVRRAGAFHSQQGARLIQSFTLCLAAVPGKDRSGDQAQADCRDRHLPAHRPAGDRQRQSRSQVVHRPQSADLHRVRPTSSKARFRSA